MYNLSRSLTNDFIDSSVSKQKDPSRVVSQSAYLLFYRRRSDVPLGGPRFQQILQDFDNPPDALADDVSESGEDQGLVANSSLRGSSSALTGVGAAHHHPNGSADGAETMTINLSALENLPAYEAHDSNEEGAPLIDKNAEHVFDALLSQNRGQGYDSLHASIEPHDDEAIDLGNGYNTIPVSNVFNQGSQQWNFANLGHNSRGEQMISGTGSDAGEVASDVVQHNSSASESSLQDRLQDFANAAPEDEFVDQSLPVPDLDEEGQAATIALQADLMENMQSIGRGMPIYQATTQFNVPAETERLEVEEPAAEIHLEESDDLKMDD
jgi:ubiquitin carboxyl-terminal hydrolase 4/11/15